MVAEQQIKENALDADLNASEISLGTQNFLGSFPVDVIVFIRVEPSIIRFNCLPDSKVECLLQVLENLDIVNTFPFTIIIVF